MKPEEILRIMILTLRLHNIPVLIENYYNGIYNADDNADSTYAVSGEDCKEKVWFFLLTSCNMSIRKLASPGRKL